MAHNSSSRGPAIAVLVVAGLALSGVTAQAVPPTVAAKDVRVTLITGDRVVLRGGDPLRQSIEAGPGREGMGFRVQRTKDHTYVIPTDALRAVGSGRLDRRLFDVTGLIEAGYDDASSKVIPVLTSYDGQAKRRAPVGARLVRELPSIKGAALAVDKATPGAFLATVSGKLWLDGKRRVTLDESVPQIGGPAAWAAGYTGHGVSVAVLDTGIDATHPDLATQVAGAKNFTTDADGDHYGHGTHVASTIAGTGAASGGKYKGVAPDAKLYDGKVCDDTGSCSDSAILAGMDWAANEVKADVVNLSLGGPDGPEIDPLEEAVNRLTADTGTLFVIAAGNAGPEAGTIGSPGSADAALTVGNVDKQDQLSRGSSRGPRAGDSAVKPDVTAPGTNIVAAKAKDAVIGQPVGDQYLRLSGTSMATPHTAGAAALLLQEHPSWKPGELKRALMGSAKVAAEQTVFQQGAGRIDLGAAIKQTVLAEEGSLSFGVASFPHTDDEPVVKPLTFRNFGSSSVTLELAATFADASGAAAPAGALALSASTVTVPAGGTASVQATSNTNHVGPDGLYSGRITATGGGQTIVVPVGVDRETEAYTLTVQTIGPEGKPSADAITLYDIAANQLSQYETDGTVKLKLPKGEYMVDQFQEFEAKYFHLVAPSIRLDSNRTVVLDARKAKVVDTAPPRPDASAALTDVGFDRWTATGVFSSFGINYPFGSLYTLSIGPKLKATELTSHVASNWGVKGDGAYTNSPYWYGLVNYQPGEFPTGFQRTVRPQELAVVDTTVKATTDRQAYAAMAPLIPNALGVFVAGVPLDTPRSVRFFVDPAPEGWVESTSETTDEQNPSPRWALSSSPKHYQAGRTYRVQRNVAAFAPIFSGAARTGNDLEVYFSSYGDATGGVGLIQTDTASSALFRDGEQIATSDLFGYVEAGGLPAERTTYKLVTSATQSASPFATKVDVTATFSSAETSARTEFPIATVRFQPKVDDHNLAPRTRQTTLPIVVNGPSKLKSLHLEISGDNGTTWTTAPVSPTTKGYQAIFRTPAGSTVSLRAHLVDTAGNTTTQTSIAAYHLK